MTRGKIRLAVGAGLAIVLVAFATTLLLRQRHPGAPNRVEIPEGLDPPASVGVLFGSSADRDVLVKRRFAGPARAAFTNAALARALEADPAAFQFVEIWIVNHGDGAFSSLEETPTIRRAGGEKVELVPLRNLAAVAASDSPGLYVQSLLAALAPDPKVPLGKNSLRRTVYAARSDVPFDDLRSANIDGVSLAPAETTEARLEAFVEKPQRDLRTVLIPPAGSANNRIGALSAETGR